jgi:phosphoribosylformimino-5-aminoimidazole carboxamide ribonucleotide (ProFAR) isomerase
MYLFPAIDLYEKKAVRLYKGDYARMTVYSDDPAGKAKEFVRCGASHIHIVDLEGPETARRRISTRCAGSGAKAAPSARSAAASVPWR